MFLYSVVKQLNINTMSTIIIRVGYCVASHHSTQYDSSDGYLERINNDVLKKEILFLKNTSPDKLISKFLNEYIQSHTSIVEYVAKPILWKNV